MSMSTEKGDRTAVNLMRSWIASNPAIPLFRRHANKAEICRQVGIARSTADANPDVRELFAELDIKVANQAVSKPAVAPQHTAGEVADQPLICRNRLLAVSRDSLALEHLLHTGRVVR